MLLSSVTPERRLGLRCSVPQSGLLTNPRTRSVNICVFAKPTEGFQAWRRLIIRGNSSARTFVAGSRQRIWAVTENW